VFYTSSWLRICGSLLNNTLSSPDHTVFDIINDLILLCQAHSDTYDTKLFRHVLNVNDCDTLQGGITTLHNWTKDWLLKLDVNKCKVVSFGRNVDNSYVYELLKTISPFIWHVLTKLLIWEHINEKVNKAYSMLGIIKRNFNYLTVTSFTLSYKGIVRSHIDYCSSVWAPYKK